MGAETLRAGAAAVPITPLDEHLGGDLYLGGYGNYRSRPAEGNHDDLWARTLVLGDGEQSLAIVALDLVGISNIQLDAIRSEAGAATGLSPAHILIASTHTHHSPDLQGLWGGTPEAYKTHLRQQTVRSIIEATADQQEARAQAGSVQLTGLTRNRRGWDTTDDILTALALSRPDGSPLATLVNFAVHATVMGPENRLVSGDFPTYLREALDGERGGLAVFVNGAQGDSEPVASGDFQQARAYGEAIAEATLAALQDAEPLSGPLVIADQPLELPIENPLWQTMTDAGILEYAIPREDERPHLPTRVSYWRLGPADVPSGLLQAVSVPGEAVTRLGQAIRGCLTARHCLLLGLTHDTLGYLMLDDEWMTGRNDNYEESVSLGQKAGQVVHVALVGLAAEDQ